MSRVQLSLAIIAVLSVSLVGCDRMVAVYGAVQDPAGNPVPNATVTLIVGTKVRDNANTAPDGSFRVAYMHIPRNTDMRLTAAKAGYKSNEIHIRSTRNVESGVIIRLEKAPGM